MGKLTAFFASGLTFTLFWYLSTIISGFSLGFELPIFGWVQIAQPFEELEEPMLIVGAILSLLVFVLLLSRRSHEAKT